MATRLPSGMSRGERRNERCRYPFRRLFHLAFGLFVLACAARPASAQVPGWSVGLGAERSAVTNGGVDTTWGSESLTIGFLRETAGGWRASLERQFRGDATDVVITTGGYRRLGDWTIGASASGSPDSSFWFSRAFDTELSRRIVGTLVASAAYRYMDFATAGVHQAQPALTWYNPRGELQARLYVTRNTTLDRTSLAMLLRTAVRLNDRVAVSGAVAAGDRIFDIASLAYGTARSWTARGGVRLQISRRNEIEVAGGYAHERPVFTQRTIALSYRRAF